MAKRTIKPVENAEVDMTPMIDIVFQLIAFFMVITNFEQTQADERVKLPRDALAKPPEAKLEHEMTLNVGFERDMKGKLVDENPYLFNFGLNDKLPVLGPKVQEQLATEKRLYKQKEINIAEVTIKIRSDAQVQTGIVQELIKLCQDAGFEKFAMSAMSGSDDP
jgi:biopolymer transport protein ExbD